MFMFICWLKKKVQRTRAYQTWVPYYKELKLGKLKYHRREKKRAFKIEYYVAWNSSLAISSSMWHFFNKKIHVNTRIFFMKLECLKLDLYSKLEFQKSGIFLLILQTMVCCYKVEFYQLSCWFYSVSNLLVFQ